MFRNILVCVDGSAHAERALSEAIDLAAAERSRLTILTAIPRPPYWACNPVTVAAVEPLAADLAAEAKATLKAAVDRVPDSIPVTKILTREPIREALMARIRSGEHDLVVMGSRGRARAERLDPGQRQPLRAQPQRGAGADRPHRGGGAAAADRRGPRPRRERPAAGRRGRLVMGGGVVHTHAAGVPRLRASR